MMKTQLSKQISIAKHIIDGSITIDSITEFQGMLQIFPNDPALRRAYADLLLRKQLSEAAAQAYHQAADLYAAAGLLLQAIVCQFLKWQIKKPSSAETQKLWNTLQKSKYHEIPTNAFFAALSPSALLALIKQIEIVRLPAGKTISKIGNAENALYFIVAGSVEAATYEPQKKSDDDQPESSVVLTENDFFGHLYPSNENRLSYCHTVTVGQTELVRILRENLRQVCRKHPRMELALIDLFRVRSEKEDLEALRSVRKADRHKLPIKMNLKIWPGSAGHYGLILDGLCRDISVDGMCIVLDAKYANVSSIYKSIQNAKIEMSMPSEAMTVNVLGSIAWSKEIYNEQQKRTVALGIRFEQMSPQMSGLLMVFANLLNDSE
ncbi:MAG: cyclic nucleotide-binding domain-containing protein [Desulfobacterales bacterium]|nr:cyclic nucleotide-binding domain-containing protein [Desulfobacterales bacterium]